ncbi:CubicO group peptidase (beta-lactamase class C family) [Microbacterium endophyticum]|uniref:CubicO group peptidase (Beta-lactamase class C family) n=1 Tax=Microbacterium endophyticum TaxID=1526412 RepID=A0A7W4YN69_9MICO|nr:serine hydrolase domain-containing protein [Microbacterium endophyticum]MBB2975847.1 CubicO group peptidase (beta-lactamase class C family) [Microbacterium endophyticum]NIK36330.1 CubicO group peptidase (beta-lactamase class C family) [Microbacterium endophyticum]
MNTLAGALEGYADDRLGEVVERLSAYLAGDPDLSFQAAAFHSGERVLDVWGGPHLGGDSITVPYSVTKNTIGLSIGLLLERGDIELDEYVSTYWPEFAAKDKARITVRQLLSHQAGLPQATPSLTWAELLDDHAAAARLADSRPLWHPGSAFGYHAVTIGNLAAELVFRVTGRTLRDFYEQEIRAPHDIDFYLGLPPEHDVRRVPLLPMIRPVSDTSVSTPTQLGVLAWSTPGPAVDLANDEVSWRFGHPAGSGTGTARGLAGLLASAVTGRDGRAPFLSADTVSVLSQQQVHGTDEVLGLADRAHSIVFQKPTAVHNFGGPRAFGHDGAMGALACVDPDTGIAFAWTIVRGAWPGGADPRALALARDLGTLLAR